MYVGDKKEYKLSGKNKLFAAVKNLKGAINPTPITIQFTFKMVNELIRFHNYNSTNQININNFTLYGIKVTVNKNNTIKDNQAKLIYKYGEEKIINFI